MPNAADLETTRPSGWALAAFFALLPAAGTAGALAIAPLQAVGGLAAAPRAWRHLKRPSAPLLLFSAFVVWAALSALWSPYPDHTQAFKLLGGALCGLLFIANADTNRRLARAAGAAGAIVFALMLASEALTDMVLLRAANPGEPGALIARSLGRGGTLLVCIVWGSAAALLRGGHIQRAIAVALVALTIFVATKFDVDANIIACALGVIAATLALAWPRATILALCVALASWLLAAPWVMQALPRAENGALPDSWAMREAIWRYVADQIQVRPWMGWGLDGPRTFTDMLDVRGISFRGISLHPHSASLQIWLETGLVGAVLAASALVVGGVALARMLAADRIAAAAAAGSLAAFGLFANVSFGLWQEWWIATAFIAAALTAAARRDQSIRS
ncbi:lipid A core-O-antigen ligase and related enzymes [alpha proteobacterium U9-1i]|nr:lipid A core-O-antigen ligase and related enzymes [alpha proteobacterium U9-1i]